MGVVIYFQSDDRGHAEIQEEQKNKNREIKALLKYYTIYKF